MGLCSQSADRSRRWSPRGGVGETGPRKPNRAVAAEGPQQATEEASAGWNRHQRKNKWKGSRFQGVRSPGPWGPATLVSWSPWAALTGVVHAPIRRPGQPHSSASETEAGRGAATPTPPPATLGPTGRACMQLTLLSRWAGLQGLTSPAPTQACHSGRQEHTPLCSLAEACAWLWRDTVTPRGQEGDQGPGPWRLESASTACASVEWRGSGLGSGHPAAWGPCPALGGPRRCCFLHPQPKFKAPVCPSVAADLWPPSQGASTLAV